MNPSLAYRTVRRVGQTLCWVALLGVVSGAMSGCGAAEAPSLAAGTALDRDPQLIVDDSVAPDFEALATETWEQFLEAFRGRSECFGDVLLRAERSLDSRAAYDPDTATVTVRVPGSPAMLKSALVHEWAHHVEFQCDEHQALRRDFLLAQGLPPDTPWRSDEELVERPTDEWAEMPSEQYAEATIVVVLGVRHIPTSARVTTEGVRVIEAWARGD